MHPAGEILPAPQWSAQSMAKAPSGDPKLTVVLVVRIHFFQIILEVPKQYL